MASRTNLSSPRGGVTVTSGLAPSRRAFLRAAPAASFALTLPAAAAITVDTAALDPAETRQRDGIRLRPAAPSFDRPQVIRDFADPYLELTRLLREASAIEHALMLQYLYGAFSLKPAYQALAGAGNPNAGDLLGVAVQEMQHLAAVNRLLVAIGAAPNLVPVDFPSEPSIYPFAFSLEPLSRRSLAKYCYCEAPVDALLPGSDKRDAPLARAIKAALGPSVRPNHIGSFYGAVIDATKELAASDPSFRRLDPWVEKLEKIRAEGEDDHFRFFKSLFLGTHEGFGGRPDPWSLPASHPDYPSHALPSNPTAYVGHDNQIDDPESLSIAWLANLHYWSALLLLDRHFRHGVDLDRDLAVMQMMGPLQALARHLASRGTGVPFDPLNVGYAPALDQAGSLRFVRAVLREAATLGDRLAPVLPAEYPLDLARETIAQLDTAEARKKVAQAHD